MSHLQRITKVFAIALIIGFFGVGLTACENEGPAEEAGEEVDEAFEETGDAIDETADEAEDAADEVEDELQ